MIVVLIAATAASACTREPIRTTAKTPELAPDALWFGGDVHFGVSARSGLGDIAPSLAGAVGIVNLEGLISRSAGGSGRSGGDLWLRNPSDAPAKLRSLGVAVASIHNNHREDFGVQELADTMILLKDAGIESANRPSRLSVGPSPYTLIAADLLTPNTAELLSSALDTSTGSLRIVSLHVTGPASYLPRPELIAAVDAAVAHGADIVVAHGTHVIGPVERRGNTVIAWGLGNLFFDCECTTEDEAVILRVSLGPGHPAQVIPIRAGLGGRDANLHEDPAGVFDLLQALNSSPLTRGARAAEF